MHVVCEVPTIVGPLDSSSNWTTHIFPLSWSSHVPWVCIHLNRLDRWNECTPIQMNFTPLNLWPWMMMMGSMIGWSWFFVVKSLFFLYIFSLVLILCFCSCIRETLDTCCCGRGREGGMDDRSKWPNRGWATVWWLKWLNRKRKWILLTCLKYCYVVRNHIHIDKEYRDND